MKWKWSIAIFTLASLLAGLIAAKPAAATAPLPSNFHGTVMLNDIYVTDGTVIQALIRGKVYAQGLPQISQGKSVYSLDIPGDNTSTTERDGGREGDTVQFKIGGILAPQTGTWHSGSSTRVDLTARGNVPVPSPTPTDTAIVTKTDTATATPTAIPFTTTVSPVETATAGNIPTPTMAVIIGDKESNATKKGFTIAIALTVIAGITLLFLQKRK